MMCDKCGKLCGLLLLVIGILFLLQDLAVWSFWNLNWYTVAFLLFGLCHLGKFCCKECKVEAKKKK
ncbi:hypothetical protein J4434_00020 [Candidatus Woesearchaeota archaeon]|nr:hypothetical protein [Candidatus Woesearchaeota archaeon]